MEVIKIENLTKNFGDVRAVDGLNFTVKKGEFFAFLGVNGAGKSTTISIICGQLKMDGGTVEVNGRDISADNGDIKRSLGVVFQNSALDKSLSVSDNLKFRAALYGITGKNYLRRLEELCSLLDLKPLLNRQLSKLSGGQKRRVDIARALLHDPDILILDEPTTGLDPQTRRTIWNVIDGLRKKSGLTVLLTTHYMEEAADADYVLIIDGGKAVAEGTPLQLKNKYTGDFITVYGCGEEQIKMLGVSYEKIPGAFRIAVSDTAEATKLIVSNPDLFSDYEVTKGKMDDVFLAVTGKKIAGA